MKASILALGAALAVAQAAPLASSSASDDPGSSSPDMMEPVVVLASALPEAEGGGSEQQHQGDTNGHECKSINGRIVCHHTRTVLKPGPTVYSTKPIVIPIAHTRTVVSVLQPSLASPEPEKGVPGPIVPLPMPTGASVNVS